MSKKTALVFVSGGQPDDIRKFENNIKSHYLKGDPANYPCLTFFHQSSEREILDKVRAKKPAFIIFDHVKDYRINEIKKTLLKKMNGTSPEMLHTGIDQDVPGVKHMPNHESILSEVLEK
jgi:hypothetical protein